MFDLIDTEAELDELLTRPSPALVQFIRTLAGPLVILGAGGKMGPSLAVLACRAAQEAGHPLEVIAVSRFSSPSARSWLEERGVKTLSCDLLESDSLKALPDAPNVLHLVGVKFGTAQNPCLTWAANALVPAFVARRYERSRIVALSTGNVYALSPLSAGGSLETAPLTPVGEYANTAVARERFLEFYSGRAATPIALMRLFYAVELRYGVLVDLARKLLQGEPLDLSTGYFNCIWQGDANEMVLRALALASSPASAWNLCQPQIFSVRQIAERLAQLMGCAATFTGQEAPTALLGNSAKLCAALGRPSLSMDKLLGWTAHWVKQGGRSLDKPTHFEVRNGQY